MKVHEFTRLENKLKLKTRNSGDRLAWFEHDGKAVVFTKRSHGNKEPPENLIRQQLKVNEIQFSGLLSCSVSREMYVEILRGKKIIAGSDAIEPNPKPPASSPRASGR
jgi:hypothetical protein